MNRKQQSRNSQFRLVPAQASITALASVRAPDWSRHLLDVSLIVVWLSVLLGLPTHLPTQLASWLTFLGLFIAPGYLMADILTRTMRLDWIERLALAFPVGIACMSIPGMIALLQHMTVHELAIGWGIMSAVVVSGWIGYRTWSYLRHPIQAQTDRWTVAELVLLGFVGIGFLLLLPLLVLYKLDGDAYAVGSFAADALAGLPLNSMEPLFGTDLGPGVRMAFNQSLPISYLWSVWSGIDPLTLAASASRPMIALWALFASYTLGKAAGAAMPGMGNGRRLGLLTVAIQLLIYTSSPFLRGDSVSLFFFERTTADKFLVPVTMLPVVFAMTIRFFRLGERAAWLAAAVVAFAVSAIHPLIAAMLALGLGAFGGFHLLLNLRDRVVLRRTLLVWGLAVITMGLPVVQLVMSRGEAPLAPSYPSSLEGWPIGHKQVPAFPFFYVPTLDVYGPLPDLSQLEAIEAESTTDPFLIWRFAVNMNRRRLILFDLNHYISDPNIILEPPYLLALLLLPLFIRRLRQNIAAQFVISISLAILFVMFNPLLTPLIGSVVMPWILWRFVWMLPYALIIAMGVTTLLQITTSALVRLLNRYSNGASRVPASTVQLYRAYAPFALLLTVALALSPAINQNVKSLRERAGFPYYYPTPERLLTRLDDLTKVEGAATVLADQDLSVSIPAYVANANIVAHRVPTTSEIFPADRQVEALQRLIDQDTFFRSSYLTDDAVGILRRYNVGYVVTSSGSSLDIQLRLATESFDWIMDDQSYSLYRVRSLPTVTSTINGNSELAARQWSAAERHYRESLNENQADLLALMGLADIAHARGEFDQAVSLYERALGFENAAALHYRLGQLYQELGEADESIEQFKLAQEAAPRIARFHLAVGDACLSTQRVGCAAEHYAAAVQNQNLPDDVAQTIALADLWRQRGRTDQALALYENAVQTQPSLANQLMLVGAYQEEGRFAEAEALIRLLRLQRPFSVDVLEMAGEVQVAQRNYDQAIRDYRGAVWLQELTGRETVQSRIRLAEAMLAADRFDGAQRVINRLLLLNPYRAEAHGLQGDLYSALHRTEEATAAYQQAFRLDPTQVRLYLALNNQFRQQGGDQQDMLDLLQTAMRANPDEPALAIALGDQLQRSGDMKSAFEAYQAALNMFEWHSLSNRLNPRSIDSSRAYAYAQLARVSEDLGQVVPAMNYYGAGVAAASDLAWTHVLYGDALRRRNEMAAAEEAYRRAILNDRTFAASYVRLADLLTAVGNDVEAQVLWKQALEVVVNETVSAHAGRTNPGLGSLSPPNEESIDSFDSDVAFVMVDGTAVAAANADELYAQLAANGTQLLEREEGTATLNLLTRLSESGEQIDAVIQLYHDAIERGKVEEWYPVVMAEYYKGLGDLYLLQSRTQQAVDAYRNAIVLDDWWPQARLGLARALTDAGEHEEALSQLQSAVTMAPGYVEGQIALVEAYIQRNESEIALQIARDTAEAHPGNPRATMALARAWEAQGKLENAERSYRETIAMNPGNSDAYVELATLLMEQGRNAEAEPMLHAALETNHDNINGYLQLGVMAQHKGDDEMALQWFKRAARVKPGDGNISIILLDLLERFGRQNTALSYVQDALKEHPEDLELVLRSARLQRTTGWSSDALATLLAAAQVELNDARLSAELGELYLAQGRPQAALSAYRQTIVLDPTATNYYLQVADLWRGQAEYEQAKETLKAGIEHATDPAPLYAALADLYMVSGQSDVARALLTQGLSEFGNDTAIGLAMGAYLDAQYQQGIAKEDGTEKWYTGLLTNKPDDPTIHVALGDYYLSRGRTEEALTHYETAIASDPTAAGAYLAAAEAYVAADKVGQAEKDYQSAILLEPTLATSYIQLGELYASQGRWNEAEDIFIQGMRVAPTDSVLYVAYCGMVAARGETEQALALLAEADTVAPTADMLVARAALYVELGQNDLARADLETALRKEPGSLNALIALGDLYRNLGDDANARRLYEEVATLMPGLSIGSDRLSALSR